MHSNIINICLNWIFFDFKRQKIFRQPHKTESQLNIVCWHSCTYYAFFFIRTASHNAVIITCHQIIDLCGVCFKLSLFAWLFIKLHTYTPMYNAPTHTQHVNTHITQLCRMHLFLPKSIQTTQANHSVKSIMYFFSVFLVGFLGNSLCNVIISN